MAKKEVHIVGAGLAGSEAAWQLASFGTPVCLHEMRPHKKTPAHQSDGFAELVCSNTFKSRAESTGPGLLKLEMKAMNSLVVKTAEHTAVPAGEALAVDRREFSRQITIKLRNHPLIRVIEEEVTKPEPGEIYLLATGPLTSEPLGEWLAEATTEEDLYFYDAIAPIVDADSIDRSIVFEANRYNKGGEAAYLNCPMTKDEYHNFIVALLSAETVRPRPFEKEKFYRGCQPIEAIAATGMDTLRYGPMKPVGLTDPRTGTRPWATVQLRTENLSRSAYNLVGFQTKLKYGAQQEVFRLIPGLGHATFHRMGSIHRNTYVCGPKVLRADLSLKSNPVIYLAGQITGVEGYLESAACGLLAATFIQQRLENRIHSAPPANSAMGALLHHVIGSEQKDFQPSGIHFGLFEHLHFDSLAGKKKDIVRSEISRQARENHTAWLKESYFFQNDGTNSTNIV